MIDIKNINLKRNYKFSFEEFFWAVAEGNPNATEFRKRFERASDEHYQAKNPQFKIAS